MQKKLECYRCGECCSLLIPLTVWDIQKLTEKMEISLEEFFDNYISLDIHPATGLFTLKKDQAGSCIFMNSDGCSIYDFRPMVCQFYYCSLVDRSSGRPRISMELCIESAQREQLCFMAIAIEVTKSYINRFGLGYQSLAFNKAYESLKKMDPLNGDTRIRLARNEKNLPICATFNCKNCPQRGRAACETVVTLDDVERISVHMKISAARFFSDFIAIEAGSRSGALQLRRRESCVFFNGRDNGCVVEGVKPFHCRFTPCPNQTKGNSVFDRLYLGSGSIAEQYRHQLALSVTQAYVEENGVKYEGESYRKCLKQIYSKHDAKEGYLEFCEKIKPFRYFGAEEFSGSN